ncbi:hypothetical protein MHYP_G00096910 [Metynnis hypsauchen]
MERWIIIEPWSLGCFGGAWERHRGKEQNRMKTASQARSGKPSLRKWFSTKFNGVTHDKHQHRRAGNMRTTYHLFLLFFICFLQKKRKKMPPISNPALHCIAIGYSNFNN